mgnify:CR=1 FL=1
MRVCDCQPTKTKRAAPALTRWTTVMLSNIVMGNFFRGTHYIHMYLVVLLVRSFAHSLTHSLLGLLAVGCWVVGCWEWARKRTNKRRTANGERRTSNGERRTNERTNKRRTTNDERRTANLTQTATRRTTARRPLTFVSLIVYLIMLCCCVVVVVVV